MLAENVANSDTPNFKPRDLVAPKFDKSGALPDRWGAGADAHQSRRTSAPAGRRHELRRRTARPVSKTGPPATPSTSKTR